MTIHALGQMIEQLGVEIDQSAPWIMLSMEPVVGRSSVSLSPYTIAAWVRDHVAGWPAPFAIGAERVEFDGDRVLLASFGDAASNYCGLFTATGGSATAIQIGQLRFDPERRWALGEGAIAWLTIALLRLAAAYAQMLGARGGVVVELSLTSAGTVGEAPLEIWNHESGTFAATGSALTCATPVRRTFDASECLSADLLTTARPFVVGLLAQFGVEGSRHIDASGALHSAHFAGHSDRIVKWAKTMNVRVTQ